MQGLKESLHSGKQKMFSVVLVGVGLLAMTGVMSATMLNLSAVNSGLLNGGNLSVQVNSGAGACINFYNGASPDACNPGPGGVTDNFTLNAPSDAIFGVVGTTVGTTHDFLASNQTSTAPGNAPYINGTAFLAINGITFDITTIVVPNVLPTCPPGGAPGACAYGDFTFTQLDFNTLSGCPGGINPCGQVNVGFTARGIGYTGTSATGSTPFTFNWSSQFVNETTGDLINKATTGSVLDAVSFTAQGSNVPEPTGFVLVGMGLLAVSALRRRVRR